LAFLVSRSLTPGIKAQGTGHRARGKEHRARITWRADSPFEGGKGDVKKVQSSKFKVSRLWFLVSRSLTPGIKAQGTGHRAGGQDLNIET